MPFAEVFRMAKGAEEIAIRFEKFGDGRGFSLAAMLRERGYKGVLKAVGDLLPDQAGLLVRAGFDRIVSDVKPTSARWKRPHFSHAYQPAPDGQDPAYRARMRAARQAKVDELNRKYADASPNEIVAVAVREFEGRIAALSSFGTEAAVGLSVLARVAPTTPVLFLDTGMHFAQTLDYKERLTERLGLSNIIMLKPDEEELAAEDADARLYETDTLACCALRKVRPLEKAMTRYDALITGRKRYHGGERVDLLPFEFDGERIKVNPLAAVTPKAIATIFGSLDLPGHPMAAQGYPSIGCWPCTAPADGQGTREGRWAGQDRTECGIFDPRLVERAARTRSYRLI
jgi:phosphoadenylyl-sulfate reductase (thioredoxin)